MPDGLSSPTRGRREKSGLLRQWPVEEAPGVFSAHFRSKGGEDRKRGGAQGPLHLKRRGLLLPANPELLGKVHTGLGSEWLLPAPQGE